MIKPQKGHSTSTLSIGSAASSSFSIWNRAGWWIGSTLGRFGFTVLEMSTQAVDAAITRLRTGSLQPNYRVKGLAPPHKTSNVAVAGSSVIRCKALQQPATLHSTGVP